MSNLCINLYNTAGAIVRDLTPAGPADKVTTADYNGYFNLSDPRYQLLKTSGGYGEHDVNTNPDFVDATRNLVSWDTSNDGPGTSANTIAEMLKLNGTGGTYNSDYSISNLLAYVRAGFTPRAAALRGTGEGGVDIGALAVANTAPSITFNDVGGWNKGETSFSYNLTDPDADPVSITVEYSTDNVTWYAAAKGVGGDEATGLTSSASPGTAYTFVWDTIADLPTTKEPTVYLRITPSDGGGGLSAYISGGFGVDNATAHGAAAANQARQQWWAEYEAQLNSSNRSSSSSSPSSESSSSSTSSTSSSISSATPSSVSTTTSATSPSNGSITSSNENGLSENVSATPTLAMTPRQLLVSFVTKRLEERLKRQGITLTSAVYQRLVKRLQRR